MTRQPYPVTTDMTPEQWVEEFRAWVHSHSARTQPLSDEAISREFIYRERGLTDVELDEPAETP